MTDKIFVLCPSCRARIKAPAQLLGKERQCPGCGHAFIIRDASLGDTHHAWNPLQDSAPILITEADTVAMFLGTGEAKTDQTERLEQLEAENARLKHLLAELAKIVEYRNAG